MHTNNIIKKDGFHWSKVFVVLLNAYKESNILSQRNFILILRTAVTKNNKQFKCSATKKLIFLLLPYILSTSALCKEDKRLLMVIHFLYLSHMGFVTAPLGYNGRRPVSFDSYWQINLVTVKDQFCHPLATNGTSKQAIFLFNSAELKSHFCQKNAGEDDAT